MSSYWIISLRNRLQKIQNVLSFEGLENHPQFASKKGLGRSATLATILGIIWGMNFTCLLLLSLDASGLLSIFHVIEKYIGLDRLHLLWQWCAYITMLCTFHLLEFFTTVLYNPSEASSDSFLVNHSTGYTAAFLTSSTEFWVRFFIFPRFRSNAVSAIGFILALASQAVRATAMITAAESFNHLIQTKKKDNHVLVTHGIYSVLRHPAYVGFYYWSVSTQLLLGNPLHTFAFAVVSWSFFQRRIAYEEESLCHHFPKEYADYVARTWIGIPFLYSRVGRE